MLLSFYLFFLAGLFVGALAQLFVTPLCFWRDECAVGVLATKSMTKKLVADVVIAPFGCFRCYALLMSFHPVLEL